MFNQYCQADVIYFSTSLALKACYKGTALADHDASSSVIHIYNIRLVPLTTEIYHTHVLECKH